MIKCNICVIELEMCIRAEGLRNLRKSNPPPFDSKKFKSKIQKFKVVLTAKAHSNPHSPVLGHLRRKLEPKVPDFAFPCVTMCYWKCFLREIVNNSLL